jgi:hypothetical protein
MTKFKLIGAAAIVFSALAGPAMAQHMTSHPHYFARGNCEYREPGNPYTPQSDYMAWSAWRARGGWDSSGDDACWRGSHLQHHTVGF